MISVFSIAIPILKGNAAGGGGHILYVLSSAAALDIQAFGGDKQVIDAVAVPGGIKFSSRVGFDRWAAQFDGGGNGTILVAISDQEVIQDDVQLLNLTGTVNVITEGGSGLQDSADASIAGAGKTVLLAANSARRSAIITSLPANNAAGVRVGADADVAANKGTFLGPGQSVTLDTVAAISAWAVAANIGDKFTLTEVLA